MHCPEDGSGGGVHVSAAILYLNMFPPLPIVGRNALLSLPNTRIDYYTYLYTCISITLQLDA